MGVYKWSCQKSKSPLKSMAHYIFYTQNPADFYSPVFRRWKPVSLVLTGFSISTHMWVCVKQEGKQELGRERRNQRHRGENTPKIHQGLRLHLWFQCDLYHPITAGRIKWRVRVHENRILLTLTQDPENLIWKWERSYCDRKSMESGWYSTAMTIWAGWRD